MKAGARAQHPKQVHAAMARGAHLKQTVAASYIDTHHEKYTDEALAQKANVSVNTVRNLWKGANAEVSTLLGVATASGMSILDLLTAMQGRPLPRQDDPVERIARAIEALRPPASPSLRQPEERIAPEDLAWIAEQTARALALPKPRPRSRSPRRQA